MFAAGTIPTSSSPFHDSLTILYESVPAAGRLAPVSAGSGRLCRTTGSIWSQESVISNQAAFHASPHLFPFRLF